MVGKQPFPATPRSLARVEVDRCYVFRPKALVSRVYDLAPQA